MQFVMMKIATNSKVFLPLLQNFKFVLYASRKQNNLQRNTKLLRITFGMPALKGVFFPLFFSPVETFSFNQKCTALLLANLN